MSTARTCTTPEDGWALYSHFIGNILLVIRSQQKGDDEDEGVKDKRERVISDNWAKLVGNLYMIMRRMRACGHVEVADKMQQIVDMTVEMDLANPSVHDFIHAKYKEFSQSKFDDELTKLRELYSRHILP